MPRPAHGRDPQRARPWSRSRPAGPDARVPSPLRAPGGRWLPGQSTVRPSAARISSSVPCSSGLGLHRLQRLALPPRVAAPALKVGGHRHPQRRLGDPVPVMRASPSLPRSRATAAAARSRTAEPPAAFCRCRSAVCRLGRRSRLPASSAFRARPPGRVPAAQAGARGRHGRVPGWSRGRTGRGGPAAASSLSPDRSMPSAFARAISAVCQAARCTGSVTPGAGPIGSPGECQSFISR